MYKSRKWFLTGILAIATVFSATAQIHVPGTGSISGTVIDSLLNLPIDSVKLVLIYNYYTGSGAVRTLHSDRKDSTVTDADGTYHFNSVDTVTTGLTNFFSYYTIEATDIKYISTTTTYISVGDGTTTTENFGMYPLKGGIAGAVSDSLTGFPVDSVKVVLKYTYDTMVGQVSLVHTIRIDSTITDTNGKYHFSFIDAHSPDIMTSLPYYSITATKIRYDTTTTSGFGVWTSSLSRVNIIMPSTAGAIAGVVRDTVNKKAVNGAKVVLLKKTCSSSPATGCTTIRMDSITTTGQGNFIFANVPASSSTISYSLEVACTGYQAAVSNNVSVVSKKVVNVTIGVAPVPSGVVPAIAMGKTSRDRGMVALYDMKGRVIWRGETRDGRIQVPLSVSARGTVFVTEVKNAAGISTRRVSSIFVK
jgi:hypothetical protein